MVSSLDQDVRYFHQVQPPFLGEGDGYKRGRRLQITYSWGTYGWLHLKFFQVNDTGVVSAAAKSLQSCATLCDPIDSSPPGSPVPGILQARTREWVAISFSNAWKWKVKVKSLSRVRLSATPWTAAHQAPPSMGFSRQEYWSGVPLPSPGVVSRLLQRTSFSRQSNTAPT